MSRPVHSPTVRGKPANESRAGAVSGLLAVLASACAMGLGPRALRSDRPDYNEQIIRSADAELLLIERAFDLD